jgi:hypothetical protein
VIGVEGGESEVGEGSTVMAGWVGWRDTDFNHSVWWAAFFGCRKESGKEIWVEFASSALWISARSY